KRNTVITEKDISLIEILLQVLTERRQIFINRIPADGMRHTIGISPLCIFVLTRRNFVADFRHVIHMSRFFVPLTRQLLQASSIHQELLLILSNTQITIGHAGLIRLILQDPSQNERSDQNDTQNDTAEPYAFLHCITHEQSNLPLNFLIYDHIITYPHRKINLLRRFFPRGYLLD